MHKRFKLISCIISLIIASAAMTFGVFSSVTPRVSVTGTIAYTARDAVVQVELSVINAWHDDDDDGALISTGTGRNVVVKNFNSNYAQNANFSYVSGNAERWIVDDKWNIGDIFFNPSANVVPSNQSPATGQVSATISMTMKFYNHSPYAIKVIVTPSAVGLKQIGFNGAVVGYDLTIANIASIAACSNHASPSSATSTIYLKLNDLSVDLSFFNFGFDVLVSKV